MNKNITMPDEFVQKRMGIDKTYVLVAFFWVPGSNQSALFSVTSFLLFYFNTKSLIATVSMEQMTTIILLQKKEKMRDV